MLANILFKSVAKRLYNKFIHAVNAGELGIEVFASGKIEEKNKNSISL